jgi:acyl dehydratase
MSDGVQIGQRATIEHTFSEQDVVSFARLTGDDNPIHLDDSVAARYGFDRRVVHGMLVAALISRVLGTALPGPGTIYLGQTLRFVKPVYLGTPVTVEVEVIGRREDKPILELVTRVLADGALAVDGAATVLLRSRSESLAAE